MYFLLFSYYVFFLWTTQENQWKAPIQWLSLVWKKECKEYPANASCRARYLHMCSHGPPCLIQSQHLLYIYIYIFFFNKDLFFNKFLKFIYLFMAVLGLRFCARAFSSCGKRGPLFIVVRGPHTIAVSLVAEHRLQMRRLSSCGSWAQPLRGMWDLPRAGLEPVSPALAGRFSTTVPPGKPHLCTFTLFWNNISIWKNNNSFV